MCVCVRERERKTERGRGEREREEEEESVLLDSGQKDITLVIENSTKTCNHKKDRSSG